MPYKFFEGNSCTKSAHNSLDIIIIYATLVMDVMIGKGEAKC